jgi:protein-S-isoprenylcysteine O-methyltransferase Ste14
MTRPVQDSRRMALDHRIPPPVVALLLGGAMWLLAQAGPVIALDAGARATAAVLLFLLGGLLDVSGMVSFRRARTTVNPLQPGSATALVTRGVYRYTRNPMYLGMLVMLLAWAIHLAAPVALLGPLGYWLYVDRFQIAPEERALAALFGEPYAAYKARVRRWL